MELQHIYHLFRRAAFGILPKEANTLLNYSREEIVEMLLKESETSTPVTVDLSPFDDFFAENPNATNKDFSPIIMEHKELRLTFNKAWVDRMLNPSERLNERMTLFWANTFVCQENVPPFVQRFNNTLRENALGNFESLVASVSREPAMMKFLNTNQNRKGHPNENFARELMELFTLGTGHYTETDVKEAARAFTGWSHRVDGTFVLRKRQHDYGIKSFQGWNANLGGEEVISIIVRKKECAQFICEKIYRYFVNDRVNPAHVAELAEIFHPRGNIKDVIEHMLLSDWFYDTVNIGSKIKSPMDFFASIHLVVPFQFQGDKELVFMQRLLGQLLLNPPNVAGWEGGKSWIDTNTLMTRLKLPSLMIGSGLVPSWWSRRGFGINQESTYGAKLKVKEDWTMFDHNYGGLNPDELTQAVLAGVVNNGTAAFLDKLPKDNQRDLVIQLMSLPEFQLT